MRCILAAFAAVLLGALLSPAAILQFTSPLGPEAPGATGTGNVSVVFDTTAQTLAIDAIWSGLSGTTTVAHIHCCVATAGTGTAGVAVTPGTLPGFPVGVSSGIYNVVLDLTQTGTFTGGFLTAGGGTAAGASAFLLQNMFDGKAYFNVHSSTFGGGEIRGFLAPVPEPATFGLAGLALAALIGLRRRRAS